MPIGQQVQGQLAINSTAPASDVNQPLTWNMLLKWTNEKPLPVELQLEITRITLPAAGVPSSNLVSFLAGATQGASVAKTNTGIVKLEFGGHQPRTIYADLANGRFRLGAQESVRVSVAFWGTTTAALDIQIRGSVALAQGDADPLRYSFSVAALAAAANFAVLVPSGARYFDVYASNSFGAVASPKLRVTGSACAGLRDLANGIYYPPWSPLPINGATWTAVAGSLVTITNDGTGAADFVGVFFII